MGNPLPAGTVTFLFTDVEGSTKLLQAAIPAWVRPMHDDYVAEIRAQIDESTYHAALDRGRLLALDDVETLVREAVISATD